MARYTGPDCRLCRREKTKLFLKGSKCESPKCPVEKRPYPPGDHGRGRLKESEYNLQLREKQKARRIYGVLEKQFHNYYVEAARRKGITGETLLQLLETRLDNVVYRGGLARSRDQARQLVRHSHVTVNGRKVNIPSYLVDVNDVIAVSEKSSSNNRFKKMKEDDAFIAAPKWLERDKNNLTGKVIALPARDDIDFEIAENLIVELYSK